MPGIIKKYKKSYKKKTWFSKTNPKYYTKKGYTGYNPFSSKTITTPIKVQNSSA